MVLICIKDVETGECCVYFSVGKKEVFLLLILQFQFHRLRG